MQKIIIYLQSDHLEEACWTQVAESGMQQTYIGNLTELTSVAAENEVIVIAPAEDVLLTEIKLPKLNRQRLLQALPFAIEEQLLTDIHDLHFAIGEYQPEGLQPVAIVTKQKMQSWLTALSSAMIFPAAILPAPLAIPFLENCWNIFIIGEIAIIRTDKFTGFSCDTVNLKELIELALMEETRKPQAIYLENFTQTPLALTINNANIIEKISASPHFTEYLTLKTLPLINLLQAPFQPKHKPSQNKKIWVLASYLIIACLGVTLFSDLISLSILHYQTAKLDKNIAQIYQRNFPKATAISAPKERMTEKLNNLQNAGNKNQLLVWIAALGKSMAEISGIDIKQIDYRSNQLSLQFSTSSFDKVDALTSSLSNQGISVQQHNVAAKDSKVNGMLVLLENKL